MCGGGLLLRPYVYSATFYFIIHCLLPLCIPACHRWLHAGTLLGAYRAQRVIPWDHDADIAMRVQQVEEFRKVSSMHVELVPHEVAIVFRTGPHAAVIAAKIVDVHTGFYCDVVEIFPGKESAFFDTFTFVACER